MQAGGDGGIGRGRSDAATQPRSKLFSNDMGVGTVADNLRADENDELGALGGIALMPEGVTKPGDLVQHRDGISAAILLLADQTGQQHSLAVGHGYLALDPPFRHGRRQAARAGRRHIADLLLDIEPYVAICADARRDPQDDAGVSIVNGVHDRVVRGQHRRAAGRYRHDIADLQRRELVVDHNQRRVGEHLDTGDSMQRIQDEARLGLGSDQEIEAGEGPINEGIRDGSGDGGDARCRVDDGRGSSRGLSIEDRACVGFPPTFRLVR